MTGFRVVAAEAGEAPGLVWAAPQQLRETYPLPSAFRYYLEPRRVLE